MSIAPYVSRPGIGAVVTAGQNFVFRDGAYGHFAQGGVIKGSKARNPQNSADTIYTLLPGQLMGKITSGGYYANSIIGVTTGALAEAGTSITLSAAEATELVRRVGSTGTFTLTGPPAASGVARSVTVTYSAVNTTTGVVTITAVGVNQAEDVRLNPASTGGNLQLNVAKTDGTFVTTANIAWNATDATYLAAINTALDTATGVVGGIVATAISATDPDVGFTLTYSGTGYAGLSWRQAEVAVLPTSTTDWYVVARTAAVRGAFIAGSFVGDTDGSQVPLTLIPDGLGLLLDSSGANADVSFPDIPTAGFVQVDKVQSWPTDSGLKNYIRTSLNTNGTFQFSDKF